MVVAKFPCRFRNGGNTLQRVAWAGSSSRAMYLVVVLMTVVPVVVLFPFVSAPLIHVDVLSVCFVFPLDIAVVLRRGLRLTTRRKQGGSQYTCKQDRNEIPKQRAHSSPLKTIRRLRC